MNLEGDSKSYIHNQIIFIETNIKKQEKKSTT